MEQELQIIVQGVDNATPILDKIRKYEDLVTHSCEMYSRAVEGNKRSASMWSAKIESQVAEYDKLIRKLNQVYAAHNQLLQVGGFYDESPGFYSKPEGRPMKGVSWRRLKNRNEIDPFSTYNFDGLQVYGKMVDTLTAKAENLGNTIEKALNKVPTNTAPIFDQQQASKIVDPFSSYDFSSSKIYDLRTQKAIAEGAAIAQAAISKYQGGDSNVDQFDRLLERAKIVSTNFSDLFNQPFTQKATELRGGMEQVAAAAEKSGKVTAKTISQQSEEMEKSAKAYNKAAAEEGKVRADMLKKSATSLDLFQNRVSRLKDTFTQFFTSAEGFSTGVFMAVGSGVQKVIDLATRYVPEIIKEGDIARAQKARLSIFNKERDYGGLTDDKAWERVAQTATATRTELGKTADLVNKLLVANVFDEKTAVSSSISMAGLINRALIAGGGTVEENQRALLQLTQGLSSGVLQGDELRSIREQSPYLMRTMSEGIKKAYVGKAGLLGMTEEQLQGIDVGTMKQLGAQGVLTSAVLVRAFDVMREKIAKDFEAIPVSAEQSMINVKTLWKAFSFDISGIDRPMGKFRQVFIDFQNFLASDKGIKIFGLLENALNACAIAFGIFGDVSMAVLGGLADSPVAQILLLAASITALGFALKTALAPLVTFAKSALVPFLINSLSALISPLGLFLTALVGILAVVSKVHEEATTTTPTTMAVENALMTDPTLTGNDSEYLLKSTQFSREREASLPEKISDQQKKVENGAKSNFSTFESAAKGIKLDPIEYADAVIGEINDKITGIQKQLQGGIKTSPKIDREDLEFMKDYSMHNFMVNLNAPAPQVSVNTGDINNGVQLSQIVDQIADIMGSSGNATMQDVNTISLSGFVPARS